MRISVIGCGAMGSIYAGYLAESGNEVMAIDTWKEHLSAINKNGLTIQGPDNTRTITNIKASNDFLSFSIHLSTIELIIFGEELFQIFLDEIKV